MAFELALADFTSALRAKFWKKRKEGKRGWDEAGWDALCRQQMRDHAMKGDPVDVGLFALFLFNLKGEGNE